MVPFNRCIINAVIVIVFGVLVSSYAVDENGKLSSIMNPGKDLVVDEAELGDLVARLVSNSPANEVVISFSARMRMNGF